MSSRYFLWEGASVSEKKSRLNLGDFRNVDNPIIRDLIDETSVLRTDFTENSKGDLFGTLREKLSEERRNSFYENLFDAVGEKGSRANLQFYTASGLEYDSLIESLDEVVRDEDPQDVDIGAISERVFEYKSYDGENYVDILFVLSETERVDTENAENIDREDVSGGNIKFTDRTDVECRVYLDKGGLAITRTGTDPKTRNRIRTLIQDWADGTVGTSLELGENELLCLQNRMQGENCGLDFGNFRDANIRSAKYRGDRTEALANSGVLTPAQDQGIITQVRFYTRYKGSTKPRDVQVRAYRDGHISASKNTEPDFADEIFDHILTVLEHKENLRRVEDLIEDFTDELFKKSVLDGTDGYKSRMTQAMEDAVLAYFDVQSDSFQEVEIQAYRSVIANSAKFLLETEIDQGLNSAAFASVPNAGGSSELPSETKALLDDIAEYELKQPNYDYDRVRDHLHSVLNEGHNSPISVLESVESKYN